MSSEGKSSEESAVLALGEDDIDDDDAMLAGDFDAGDMLSPTRRDRRRSSVIRQLVGDQYRTAHALALPEDKDPRKTTVGVVGTHPASGEPLILACGCVPVEDEKTERLVRGVVGGVLVVAILLAIVNFVILGIEVEMGPTWDDHLSEKERLVVETQRAAAAGDRNALSPFATIKLNESAFSTKILKAVDRVVDEGGGGVYDPSNPSNNVLVQADELSWAAAAGTAIGEVLLAIATIPLAWLAMTLKSRPLVALGAATSGLGAALTLLSLVALGTSGHLRGRRNVTLTVFYILQALVGIAGLGYVCMRLVKLYSDTTFFLFARTHTIDLHQEVLMELERTKEEKKKEAQSAKERKKRQGEEEATKKAVEDDEKAMKRLFKGSDEEEDDSSSSSEESNHSSIDESDEDAKPVGGVMANLLRKASKKDVKGDKEKRKKMGKKRKSMRKTKSKSGSRGGTGGVAAWLDGDEDADDPSLTPRTRARRAQRRTEKQQRRAAEKLAGSEGKVESDAWYGGGGGGGGGAGYDESGYYYDGQGLWWDDQGGAYDAYGGYYDAYGGYYDANGNYTSAQTGYGPAAPSIPPPPPGPPPPPSKPPPGKERVLPAPKTKSPWDVKPESGRDVVPKDKDEEKEAEKEGEDGEGGGKEGDGPSSPGDAFLKAKLKSKPRVGSPVAGPEDTLVKVPSAREEATGKRLTPAERIAQLGAKQIRLPRGFGTDKEVK